MSDANFASLSSTLLARKGGAKPAMRPQSAVLGPVDGASAAANLEDLGWNDMGEDTPALQPDQAPAPTQNHASASLAESGLIKARMPALPPLEDRNNHDDADEEDEEGSARVISISPLQQKERQTGPNKVRESLDRIADQLDSRKQDEVHDEDGFEDDTKAAPAAAPEAILPKAITPAPARSKAVAKGKRAAFTLRLDPERHLMLRLACTVRGSSAQQLVTDALDGLLAEMPEIAMLAAQVQRGAN